MTNAVLSVEDLHVSYGPIKAVRGCSFRVEDGETVAVVGANGAGKTTLMRALCNLLPRERGTITFLGESIGNQPPHALARAGILHLPEGRGTIGQLTVSENLRIAYDVRPCDITFEVALQHVFSRFPQLQERLSQKAGSLSGGEQQMLALSKAIVNPPRVLLVDEPSLGLSPLMVREAFGMLGEFQRQRISILLVEQNVRAALSLASRGYVIRQGQIVVEGEGGELLARDDILREYLGPRRMS